MPACFDLQPCQWAAGEHLGLGEVTIDHDCRHQRQSHPDDKQDDKLERATTVVAKVSIATLRARSSWPRRVEFVRPHPLRPSPRCRAIDLPPPAQRPDRAARESVPPRAFGEAQRDSASAEAVLKMMTSEQRPAPTRTAMAAAARSSFMGPFSLSPLPRLFAIFTLLAAGVNR